jgi:hypothetical protein
MVAEAGTRNANRPTTSLLYFCEKPGSCSGFQDWLTRQGFRLVVSGDIKDAAILLLSSGCVDAVLIHHDEIARGSVIGSAFKLIRPQTPILLLSAESPHNGVLPQGVDALCYGNFRSDYAARDVVTFLRQTVQRQGETQGTWAAKPAVYPN